MTLPHFQRAFVDTAGNVRPGLSVTVRDESNGALAALYSDRDGNVSISNPIVTDSNGEISFYSALGEYRLIATGVDYRDVALVTATAVNDAVDAAEAARDAALSTAAAFGYTGTGVDGEIENYTAGIELTEYTQIVRDGGEFWRASASTTLPYTLTGAGVPEGGTLVSVGDAALRQELANALSAGEGALSVAGASVYVQTIAELRAIPISALSNGRLGKISTTKRAGDFTWQSGDFSIEVANDEVTPGEGDGGIYIAPSGDKTGASGAWKRVITSEGVVHVAWYGAAGDGVTDDSPVVQHVADLGYPQVMLGRGDYKFNSAVTLKYSGQRLVGKGKDATLVSITADIPAFILGIADYRNLNGDEYGLYPFKLTHIKLEDLTIRNPDVPVGTIGTLGVGYRAMGVDQGRVRNVHVQGLREAHDGLAAIASDGVGIVESYYFGADHCSYRNCTRGGHLRQGSNNFYYDQCEWFSNEADIYTEGTATIFTSCDFEGTQYTGSSAVEVGAGDGSSSATATFLGGRFETSLPSPVSSTGVGNVGISVFGAFHAKSSSIVAAAPNATTHIVEETPRGGMSIDRRFQRIGQRYEDCATTYERGTTNFKEGEVQLQDSGFAIKARIDPATGLFEWNDGLGNYDAGFQRSSTGNLLMSTGLEIPRTADGGALVMTKPGFVKRYLWVDSSDNLRIGNSLPANPDTEGTIVGP